METKPLEYRVPKLEAVPEQFRQLYRPAEGGGFLLAVGGLPNTETLPGDPPPKPKRSAAEIEYAARDAIVARAIARLNPNPAHVDSVRRFLADRIEIEVNPDTGATYERFVESKHGYRVPSSLPGRDWAEFDEWVARIELPADAIVKAEPKPTPEEQRLADAEPFVPPKRDVLLTRSQAADFRNYEAAKAEAQRRGGKLLLVDDPVDPNPKPAPSWTPNGKDVPLTVEEARNFTRYEAAKQTAAAQGGQVVIVGDFMGGKESMPS